MKLVLYPFYIGINKSKMGHDYKVPSSINNKILSRSEECCCTNNKYNLCLSTSGCDLYTSKIYGDG